jgi:hypothetical protein
MLGAAFLLVEIPLIQRYILLLGRPAVAFAVVLFAVLTASGVGSMLSPRLGWRAAAIALVGLALSTPFVVRWITPILLPAPLGVRVAVGVGVLAPLGLLMGVMFPKGLALLHSRHPALVPWAWAINGTVSVVASAGAALLALSIGFTAVLVVGAACYAGAGLLVLLAPSAEKETLTPG